MLKKEGNNFAFIDATNVYLGIKDLGWFIDWARLRVYLRENYDVRKAYMFMGFMAEQQELYRRLQEWGYILVHKPVMQLPDGRVKGNCDAELVLQAMVDFQSYKKAIIVTGDGDFYCLVKYLMDQGKLGRVLAPSVKNCSSLLKKVAGKDIAFLQDLKKKLAYTKRTPQGRNPAGDFSS